MGRAQAGTQPAQRQSPNSTVQQGSAFPLSKPRFPQRGLQLRVDGETQWGMSSMSACAKLPRSGSFPRQRTPRFHFPSQAVISPGPWATGPSQDPSGLMHTQSLCTASLRLPLNWASFPAVISGAHCAIQGTLTADRPLPACPAATPRRAALPGPRLSASPSVQSSQNKNQAIPSDEGSCLVYLWEEPGL